MHYLQANFKNNLTEKYIPKYETTGTGTQFYCVISISGFEVSLTGEGMNKKKAKSDAAKKVRDLIMTELGYENPVAAKIETVKNEEIQIKQEFFDRPTHSSSKTCSLVSPLELKLEALAIKSYVSEVMEYFQRLKNIEIESGVEFLAAEPVCPGDLTRGFKLEVNFWLNSQEKIKVLGELTGFLS